MGPNEDYVNEKDRVLVTDETDWGNTFDDMDQDNWEDHMGGPEDDYFEI